MTMRKLNFAATAILSAVLMSFACPAKGQFINPNAALTPGVPVPLSSLFLVETTDFDTFMVCWN